jgi:hypothetical protein
VEGYGFSRTIKAQTKIRALAPEGFASYTTIEIRGKDSPLTTDFSSLRERDFFA